MQFYMNLRPKKSLGQHFLNSRHVLEQIISAANIKPGETILEIGPGTGVLTAALLKAGAKVVAVEKDDRAYEILRSKKHGEWSKESDKLVLIHGDILKLDMSSILHTSSSILPTSYAIVANIPYYITGAILERFLEHEPRPDRMVLLAQKEVAERIVARPPDGKKTGKDENRGKESVLSISVKAFGTPKIMAKVPRGAFTPAPSVDSAILTIDNVSDGRFTSKTIDIKRFFELVRAGFAHKRKYLIRNLEPIIGMEYANHIWQELKLDKKVRAEDITIDQWFEIASLMAP